MGNQIKIPTLPHAFFKWYCEPDRYEELHGDLEEIFYERVEKSGITKARFFYLIDVIRSCQPYAWRKRRRSPASDLTLYGSYFKVAFRGMIKNSLNTFINLSGLSIAIGICILAYGYFQWDHDIDQFHVNKNDVYLITYLGHQDGTTQQYGTSPRPLGEMLRDDASGIKKVCRIDDGEAVVKYLDNVFNERVRYADPEFLEVFTFPLKWGAASSLADPHNIILSEDMSLKYFGEENPVGREMLIKFNEKDIQPFTVGGVAAAFPKAHDIDFNMLINFENIDHAAKNYDAHDWSKFVSATLIQIDQSSSADPIERQLEKYRLIQNQAEHDRPIDSFALEQLTTLHQRSGNIRNAISHDYNKEGRIGLPVIAILMLILGCFNYINIAIVSATKRLKEIGVRKVIGATRTKMVMQFLSENLITMVFAVVVGFVLSVSVFIPWFVNFSGGEMQFEVFDKNVLVFLAGLLIVTSIISGLYPALYISGFNALKIFRGSVEFGKKNPLTKLFLGVQIGLACVLITTGVVFTQNNMYQSELPWGYDQKSTLYVSLPDSSSFNNLEAAVRQFPGVQLTSGSTHHIGKSMTNTILHMPDNHQHEVNRFSVGENYFETMGLALTDGRAFLKGSGNEKQSVVVNELLAKNLGLEKPVGATFEIDSQRYEIIGVVKDFHSKNLFSSIEPTIFTFSEQTDYRYLSMRVASGTQQQTYDLLQSNWLKLYPDTPFEGGYQEDVWGIYFHRVDRSQKFSIIVASIAVLLAGLGLFGLVTVNVSGRSKEFSIRRTLGASATHILNVITRQYFILFSFSMLFGIPASYLFARASLNMLFAYPVPMSYSGSIIAVIILLSIFLGVISIQVRNVLKMNPVDGLKME